MRPDGEDDAVVVGLHRQLAREVEQSEGREEPVQGRGQAGECQGGGAHPQGEQGRNAMEGAASASSAIAIGVESPIDDLDTSEESLPIFDEDDDDEDDDELDLTHEIETDV